MLVLTRKLQEQIRIGSSITVTILRVKGNTVRVGIEAPRDVRVVRGELPPKEGATATITISEGQVGDQEAGSDENPAAEENENHQIPLSRVATATILGQEVCAT